jgi:hypothetical protein
MREFAKFGTGFWTSPAIQKLSDDGKLLAAYLIAGPHSNQAGVYRLPAGYVMADLCWPESRVRKGFADLHDKGFSTWCESTSWVVIHKALQHTPPENPNQQKHVVELLEQVPLESSVIPVLRQVIDAHLECLSASLFDRLVERFWKGSETLPQQREGEGDREREGEREKNKAPAAAPRRGLRNPSAFSPPEWVNPEAWRAFEEMRVKIRAPMTDTARQRTVEKLGVLRDQGHDPLEVLLQSVEHSWRGVFPLRGTTAAQSRAATLEERNRTVGADWVREGEHASH